MQTNLYLDQHEFDLVVDPATKNLRLTANDGEFLSQKIENTLQRYKGEWWLDPDTGVPWFEDVLKKGSDLATARALIVSEVSDIEGVSEISSLEVSFDHGTRRLTANMVVLMDSGEQVPVEVSL